MQDARNFSYSSDYPMPIVTYRNEFTVSAPAGDPMVLVKIEHGLPYIPLTIGKWSSTEDFTEAQDLSSDQDIDGTSLELYADETYFYFLFFKEPSVSVTRHVRVIAFAPPDYNGDIEPINNDSRFRFDSDNDYLGVYAQGVLDQSTGGVVEHNLGYAPQCKSWAYSTVDSSVPPIHFSGYKLVEPGINLYYNTGRLEYDSISTNDRYIARGRDINNDDYSLSANSKIYYHIYTKEA